MKDFTKEERNKRQICQTERMEQQNQPADSAKVRSRTEVVDVVATSFMSSWYSLNPWNSSCLRVTGNSSLTSGAGSVGVVGLVSGVRLPCTGDGSLDAGALTNSMASCLISTAAPSTSALINVSRLGGEIAANGPDGSLTTAAAAASMAAGIGNVGRWRGTWSSPRSISWLYSLMFPRMFWISMSF